jgi:hypothetical protein
MMHRSVAVFLVLLAAACDGDVSAPEEATGSGAGSGSSGTGGQGNAGTTASAGGAGGGVSTAAGGASIGSGGAGSCAGRFEADCMGTPACAPVYDDACCPTCDPGAPCADCSNPEFLHCAVLADVCNQAPACGIVPDWVCLGAPHVCPEVVGEDTYQCEATAGCVVARCSPDVNCNQVKCATVNSESCTALCDAIPPSCPAGTTAEADGSCYTGYCIPSAVCGTF